MGVQQITVLLTISESELHVSSHHSFPSICAAATALEDHLEALLRPLYRILEAVPDAELESLAKEVMMQVQKVVGADRLVSGVQQCEGGRQEVAPGTKEATIFASGFGSRKGISEQDA